MLAAALLLLASPPLPQVARIELEGRRVLEEGRSVGEAGPVEELRGRLVFALDPADPRNARIVDLGRAPRNGEGRVEAWTDFVVLQPAEASRRRGLALVEVSNRGGRAALRYFNLAGEGDAAYGPLGDGLIQRLGLTLVWLGWQHDVPDRPGLLRLHVPVARGPGGTPIEGLVRADWTVDVPAVSLGLGHRGHRAYPVADPADARNVLTVRDGRDAARRVVPRERWRFARVEEGREIPDPRSIVLDGGFQAGSIYECVYVARDPAVAGMGLAAIRDVLAFAKSDPRCPFPVRQGIAVGISQTGRFLRHFLYQGFNTDTAGRQVYDGLLILTAGAGRGSFNHRFAQPSRDAHRWSAFFYPTDLFPFTSRLETDPLTGRLDGLLARQHDPDHVPRVFYVNTGYEYWGRAAALIHTGAAGREDREPTSRERIYHVAGAQHFPWRLPRAGDRVGEGGLLHGNPMDLRVLYRALLVRMVEWVADGVQPPPSRHPRLADGTLVALADLRFPDLPGVQAPARAHSAYRADYGPRWSQGIVDLQPPSLGAEYPVLVPAVDDWGNELGGVRCWELRAPLGTFLPWSLRRGMAGGNGQLEDFFGSFLPLAPGVTRASSDPRPALDVRYADRGTFLAEVGRAAGALVEEGFLLPEDRGRVQERAVRLWEAVRTIAAGG